MSDDAGELRGLLFIGDPHLASRTPGFRSDDYPQVAVAKLRWCLEHARVERLLPVMLGDLFHWPRDNANWLLADLMDVMGEGLLTIAGNHDCHEDALHEDDSLTILARAGRARLLDVEGPWRGTLGGCAVALGGTAWGQALPERVEFEGEPAPRWTFWITHHDIGFPGYAAADPSLRPREIPGVDALINGHIHEPMPDVVRGATTWINPGNITRLRRDEADLHRTPSVLAILVGPEGWTRSVVEVPHAPSAEVFHAVNLDADPGVWVNPGSNFVQGLGELLARRTDSGAGLMEFLEQNLGDYAPHVADEIRALAREVLPDDTLGQPEPPAGH